jgi:hypothetical protein
VDPKGLYPSLLGAERCWGPDRDARRYTGASPVVAHPPCQLWVNMAAANWWRGLREGKGRPYPAWYAGGGDGGCFASALASVRRCGGVLEHPAGSWAWAAHGLRRPEPGKWLFAGEGRHRHGYINALGFEGVWVCEVRQSAYGNLCAKRTWLYYVGRRPPFELDWRKIPGTHQVGWFDRKRPTVSKKQASATPPAFAEALINLARHAVDSL